MPEPKENNLTLEEELKEKYPGAVGRKFGEGGYTFLKRVLKECLDKGSTATITSGANIFQYELHPGDKTFMDGITVLENNDEEAKADFEELAKRYIVERGREEIEKEIKEEAEKAKEQ